MFSTHYRKVTPIKKESSLRPPELSRISHKVHHKKHRRPKAELVSTGVQTKGRVQMMSDSSARTSRMSSRPGSSVHFNLAQEEGLVMAALPEDSDSDRSFTRKTTPSTAAEQVEAKLQTSRGQSRQSAGRQSKTPVSHKNYSIDYSQKNGNGQVDGRKHSTTSVASDMLNNAVRTENRRKSREGHSTPKNNIQHPDVVIHEIHQEDINEHYNNQNVIKQRVIKQGGVKQVGIAEHEIQRHDGKVLTELNISSDVQNQTFESGVSTVSL